jgi:hypothetical protein
MPLSSLGRKLAEGRRGLGGLLEDELHVGFVESTEVDQFPSLIAAHLEELFQSALVQLRETAGEGNDEVTPIWHLVSITTPECQALAAM